MRKGKTHFEQVPVEIAETVLKRAMTSIGNTADDAGSIAADDRQIAPPLSKRREKVLSRQRRRGG